MLGGAAEAAQKHMSERRSLAPATDRNAVCGNESGIFIRVLSCF
jgi:hypothetical protein